VETPGGYFWTLESLQVHIAFCKNSTDNTGPLHWVLWAGAKSELTVHFFSFNSHDTFSPSKDGYPPICGTLLASLQISSVKTEEKERALLA